MSAMRLIRYLRDARDPRPVAWPLLGLSTSIGGMMIVSAQISSGIYTSWSWLLLVGPLAIAVVIAFGWYGSR